jgi:penicillin-binding protein 1A
VGFSGTLVTGVWLGNDDGESMKRVSGGNLPVEVWQHFMTVALKGSRPVPLPGGGQWRRQAPGPGPLVAWPGGDTSRDATASTQRGRVRTAAPEERNLIERLLGMGH